MGNVIEIIIQGNVLALLLTVGIAANLYTMRKGRAAIAAVLTLCLVATSLWCWCQILNP